MRRWLVRIRGVLGLSTIGGVIGLILGAAWTAASNLMTWGTAFGYSLVQGALFWGLLSALAAGGFGVVLTALGGRRSFDEIEIWRAGLWGAIGGAAVVLTTVTILSGSIPPLLAALPTLGFSAGLGGLLGSGLVAIAKMAPAEPLSRTSETPPLLDDAP